MARAVQWVREVAPRALTEIAGARALTAGAEKALANALAALAAPRVGGA
jgi:hypothetical protein